MWPWLAGMMSGLMGSGAAGGAAGGMGGGIADLAGAGSMMGGGNSPGMQSFAQGMLATPQGNVDTSPTATMSNVGGMGQAGSNTTSAPLITAPSASNDPLMSRDSLLNADQKFLEMFGKMFGK